MPYTIAEAQAQFTQATSLARKFLTFGNEVPNDPISTRALTALQNARAAVLDSPLSDSAKAQYVREIDQYIAEINAALQRPVVTEEQNPTSGTIVDPPPADTDTELNPDSDPGIVDTTPSDDTSGEETTQNTEDEYSASPGNTGLEGETTDAQASATASEADGADLSLDWRVRLSLAPEANYFYKLSGGIMDPLAATNGVIFPYTPNISVVYAAHYEGNDITHSNYKIFSYRSSSVDTITISCDFTAQDTNEANYVLATIHFFRSLTKMFYGQDSNPGPGIPPPLVYLTGLGSFQFDKHPMVVSNFTYTLPSDVDYIRAGKQITSPGQSTAGYNNPNFSMSDTEIRLSTNGLTLGAENPRPRFASNFTGEVTYVPTKIQMMISCLPIVTRNDISNKFSLKEYATGALLQGSKRSGGGGGIW